MDEISVTTGGSRLLAALAASDASGRAHGPAARVDLDTLWIFISQARACMQHAHAPVSTCTFLLLQTRQQYWYDIFIKMKYIDILSVPKMIFVSFDNFDMVQ